MHPNNIKEEEFKSMFLEVIKKEFKEHYFSFKSLYLKKNDVAQIQAWGD